MSKEILLDAPCVGEAEKRYLCEAIDSGFVSSIGPFVEKFEHRIAEYVEANNAVAIQSGTAAIHMALYELGIGPGDEVIVPALTFAATINPILYAGATPVIVDVDIDTWNIDLEKIKEAITDKTKAIILVHLYGNSCNMIDILSIAEEHDLYVIEDATESLGAKINNKHTGTLGDFGCFSFNGNKLITTGGGGMIVSNDTERIEHIRYLVNQSKDGNKPGFHFEMGFNYRMTNIEAALGLAQMEKIDKFVAKKKIFRKVYQEILGDLSYVRFQEEYDNAAGSHWFTCVKIKKEIKIHDLMHELRNKGIPTRRIFMPTNKMPYLKKYAHECPVANKIYDYGICLPGSTLNKKKDIEETALMIREVLNG